MCSVMQDTYGYGTALENYEYTLMSQTPTDQDAECCSYCHQRTDCEFWLRYTEEAVNYCYLYKDWYENGLW